MMTDRHVTVGTMRGLVTDYCTETMNKMAQQNLPQNLVCWHASTSDRQTDTQRVLCG